MCVHVRVRVCVRSRVSRRSERDTAVIDLNLAKAQMLHAEGKMAAELEQMRQLLEAQGSKLLVASRAGKDSERLRGGSGPHSSEPSAQSAMPSHHHTSGMQAQSAQTCSVPPGARGVECVAPLLILYGECVRHYLART